MYISYEALSSIRRYFAIYLQVCKSVHGYLQRTRDSENIQRIHPAVQRVSNVERPGSRASSVEYRVKSMGLTVSLQ